VVLELTKQQKEEETILVFNVTQLGTEATMRTFDLTAVSYLRKISLDYHDIKGNSRGNRNSLIYNETFAFHYDGYSMQSTMNTL
jgi:hypothetical protein